MKAIQFEKLGGPEVLQLVELPKPQPSPGQVLIKVAAIGVNYADTMHRIGAYPQPAPLPMIPGTEVAGVVEDLGAGVASLDVGMRVTTSLYPGSSGGGYVEYVVVDAERAVLIPDGVSFEASLVTLGQGWTAYLLLTQAGKLQAGESVLIHAAAGGVGSLAVQLAKLLGAGQIIGLVGSSEKEMLLQELGCDRTFLYSDLQWSQQVKDVTIGRGVDIILDSVGGSVITQNLQALAPFGRLVTYGALSQQIANMLPEQTVQLIFGNQSYIGFSLPGFVEVKAGYAEKLTAKLLNYVAEGSLKAIAKDIFPLENAALAHQAIQERRTVGKVVLKV
ncbi:zinc-binding dehydrogenase [Scytonema sp. UIC 10036]|uniref:quinone oxidoreductase family protein n=1 Tax=Scytonema sp. UIC 10036 TaxID=2304196 RepID=UPI0012DA3693|nr:zinc-binding dehydrogenase [Scytonema sp. UIC 10036]MUG92368.1 zinc-binding dehydrogenase [Scytonema sp. UIC 10036]